GFEEFADLFVERLVSFETELRGDGVLAEDDRAVVGLASANAAEGADAAVFPDAGDDIAAVGAGAGDGFAARAHDRVEQLDAVNAVPEEIGVVFFKRRGAPGVAAENGAELRVV